MDYLQDSNNDQPVYKTVKLGLSQTRRLLVLIGKPIYFLFSRVFIAAIFILYTTGRLIRSLISHIKKFRKENLTALKKTQLAKNKASKRIKSQILQTKKKWKRFFGKTKKDLIKRKNNIHDVLQKKLKNQKSKEKVVFKAAYLKFQPLKKLKEKAFTQAKKIPKLTFSQAIAVLKLLVELTILFVKVIFRILILSINLTFKIIKAAKDKAKLLVLKTKLKITSTKKSISTVFSKILRKKIILYGFAFVLLISAVTTYAFWEIILKDLPSPDKLTERKVEVSTKIYDRNGELLYNIYKDENRTPVKLEDIPVHVRLATIAIEDAEFYKHPGFSIKGIARAAIKNLQEGELTGGSTITQQLVKNALLTPEKTIERKLKEVTLALQTELTYNKDQILQMYLNEVSYGGTAYGIQEAARTYFGKNVDQLTLAEAALLAGLPKSPSTYSPFGSEPEKAMARQKEVLRLMHENGFITQEQRNSAENEEVVFAENKTDIKAPHFVMYMRDQLEEKYGASVVEQGGLNVITTLDLDIQRLAEEVIRQEVENLNNLNVGNGAAVVLDPETGEILAMVGSKDYFNTAEEGNVNVTTSLRQPGSSIKIVNYAYALSNGYTPATIIEDTRTTFLVPDQPEYTPRNYDGRYRGNLTLRSAFAESRNVTAVKVLASYGVDKMLEMGTRMGITTWDDPSDYGLSLTLGGGDVKLIDLAQVYATVANYGERPELKTVLEIADQQREVIEDNNCQESGLLKIAETINRQVAATESGTENQESPADCAGEQVLDPRVAFMLTDVLRDNSARTPAFGSNSLLVIPNHPEVAVKTGTSNDLRDNLTIGYTKNYVVAVWVGNNDNSQMARVASGVTGATPIFNKIMSALLAEQDNQADATLTSSQDEREWQVPEGLVQLPVCTATGTLTCAGCPSTRMEWFLEENRPEMACNPGWFVEEDEDNEDEQENEEENNNQAFNYEF